jgi:hypothetical protein
MKTLRFSAIAAVLSIAVLASCKQNSSEKDYSPLTAPAEAKAPASATSSARQPIASSTGTPNSYTINLDNRTQLADGNWEWVWSIQNLNPGSGENGTAQDMSHWGMQFGECINPLSMVSAAYSADGQNWTSFTPEYAVDPSQECMTSAVFKFNYGTSGSVVSYYRLVVNQDYAAGMCSGYYKSGKTTGCNTFSFTGIACSTDVVPVR